MSCFWDKVTFAEDTAIPWIRAYERSSISTNASAIISIRAQCNVHHYNILIIPLYSGTTLARTHSKLPFRRKNGGKHVICAGITTKRGVLGVHFLFSSLHFRLLNNVSVVIVMCALKLSHIISVLLIWFWVFLECSYYF